MDVIFHHHSLLDTVWGIFLHMEVEGTVYDRHPHETSHPSPGHGWRMQWHHCRPVSGLDSPCRRFFPRCLANENIHCDGDENLWPNPQDRVEGNIEVQSFFSSFVAKYFCFDSKKPMSDFIVFHHYISDFVQWFHCVCSILSTSPFTVMYLRVVP